MARDGSGNYNLPAGNPVVAGTTITASQFNTTLADLASALTGSLPRDGQAGMTGPFRLADGTASVPAFGFNGEASTGLYRPGTQVLGFSVGAGERMRLLGNGNLLLGTTSDAGYRLDVSGSARVTGAVQLNSTLGVTGALQLNSTLGVTGASTFSGNVGIGQAPSSGARLDILRNATDFGSSIIIKNNSTGSGAWARMDFIAGTNSSAAIYQSDNGTLSINNTAAARLSLSTSNTERLTVEANGNVGIGTTADSRFHVLDGSGASLRIGYQSGSTNYYDASTHFLRNTVGTEYAQLDATGLGIGIAPTSKLDVNGITRVRAELSVLGGGDGITVVPQGAGSGAIIATRNQAFSAYGPLTLDATEFIFRPQGSEQVRITSAGNVGIGTNSPGMRLDLANASNVALRARVTEDSNYQIRLQANYSYDEPATLRGITNHRIIGQRSGSDNTVIYTNDTERMRITSSGNVGIGTASPAADYKITVATSGAGNKGAIFRSDAGEPQVVGTDNNVTQYIGYTTGSGGSAVAYHGTASNHALGLLTNNAERMRIDTSGRVGIGKTPETALDVQLSGTMARFGSGGGNNLLQLNSAAVTGLWSGGISELYSSTQLNIRTGATTGTGTPSGGTTVMTLDTSGNVGIGHTAPPIRLSVVGADSSDPLTNGIARFSNGGQIALRIGATGYNYAWLQSIQDDGTNNIKNIVLQPSGGAVGIGMNASAGLLEVNTTGSSGVSQSVYTIQSPAAPPIGSMTGGLGLKWGNVTVGVRTTHGGDANNAGLAFTTASGGVSQIDRMNINAGGNVGIGVSTSDSTFRVLGAQGTGLRIGYNNESTNYYDANVHFWRNTGTYDLNLSMNSEGHVEIHRGDLYMQNNKSLHFRDGGGTLRRSALLSSGGVFYYGDIDNAVSGSQLFLMGRDSVQLYTNGVSRVSVNSAGTCFYGGIEVGYRSIPTASTGGGTAGADIRGKSYLTTGDITVPANTFSAGDVFMIYNNSATAQNIVQGSGLTLRFGGTTSTGNRSLAGRGFATVFFISATEAVVTGAGVS